MAQLSLKDALKNVWEHFPCKFSQTLVDYCTDLFVVNASGKWFLAYAYLNANYDGDDFYEFFLGAVPQPNAQLPNELIQAGWQMPEDLKKFYKVHSVFGDPNSVLKNSKVYCISSANNLKASLGFMEEVVKEQNDLQPYSFYDLLPFWEDGGGNSQNFYKASPSNNSYMTTHWDHETRELGREMSFADYLEEQFGRRARAEW